VDFHAVAAQVLPVLFIALAFERRALEERVEEKWANIAAGLAMTLLFPVGEALSIYGLWTTSPFTGARELTAICLGGETGALVFPYPDKPRCRIHQTDSLGASRECRFSGVGCGADDWDSACHSHSNPYDGDRAVPPS
jgi:hypothetical protein